MSHGEAPYSYPGDPEPSHDRRVVRLLLVLAGVFLLLIVLCGGLVAWSIGTFAGRGPSGSAGPAASLDEKYAAVAAAFNGDSLGADESRLVPIRRLFDRITAATSSGDRAGFVQQIDTDRFLAEMQRSGAMQPLAFYEKPGAATWVRQSLYVPVLWQRYQFVHVDFQPEMTEAIVHAYFWGEDEEEYKLRWWLVRGERGWRAYDWELLGYTTRASKKMAVFYANDGDPRLEPYSDCLQALNEADRLMAEGDYQRAAEKIRQAQRMRVLPALQDDIRHQIANAWSRCGRQGETIQCYQRIASPEALPGALFGLALSYQNRGQHEKALEHASRYETLLGRSPAVSGLKGESLLALGRPDEAAAEFRKSLDVIPDQPDVLDLLAFALDDDRKHVLTEYVAQTKDPVETAEVLAQSLAAYEESAAVEAIAQWLESIAPDSPARPYIAGLAKEADGDYAQAAERFQQAFTGESDPNKKEQYVWRYLDAMVSAGQAVDGYLAAPGRAAAFEYLADFYYSGDLDIPEEDFSKLLQAHQESHPDDPWGYYYQGVLLAQQEKYDEAEKELAAGMAKTDDEETLGALRYERVWALHRAGKGMEAYEKIEPAANTFRQLAGYYDGAGSADQIALLQSLVEVHQAEHPDDPWLDFYAAIVEQHQKNYGEADRLFARACQKASEDYVKSSFHGRRLDARIESGEFLDALEEVGPPEDTFAYLAGHFSRKRQWPEVELLIERYCQLNASSPQLRYWEAELLWQRKDYSGLVQRLAPWPEDQMRQLEPWQVSTLRDRLVRSYLQLGRSSAAMAIARAACEEEDDLLPMILVSARQGKVEETLELMQEHCPPQHVLTGAYNDEDVGPILRSEEFLPVRREYPPGLSYDAAAVSVVLLLSEPRRPDADQVRTALLPVLGEDLSVGTLPARRPTDGTTSLVSTVPDGVYCLTFGSDRFTGDDDSYQPEIRDEARKEALASHNAWLAIDASDANLLGEEAEFASVCRLTAALLDEDSLAVYFSDEGQLIVVDPATREALRSDEPRRTLPPADEAVWLFRVVTADDDDKPQQSVSPRRRFRELSSAFARRGPEQELQVQVEIRCGFASELAWLRVDRVFPGTRFDDRLIGRFTSPSLLMPHYRPGEPLSVAFHQILDWKCTDADATD